MKPHTVFLLLLLAPIVLAQDPVKPAPRHVAAQKGTIRKTLELKGTFVPAGAAEIKLDLKSYRGTLKLIEAKPHGSIVNKGDIVARVDTEGIDRQITVDKMALQRAELDWDQAQERLRMQVESDRAKLERAEMDFKRSKLKLDGFLKHEKGHTEESERLGVEYRKNRLDDQHDELVQLEKMYSEDELVDATEEIVLKRSRRNYARSKANFELAERRRLYRKEFFEPWREEDLRRDLESKERSLKQTLRSQQMSRAKTDLDMKKKRYELGRTRQRFTDLENDRKQFEVRAPAAGLLLHGSPKGPWGKLEKGSSVSNRAVFVSIAVPRRLKVSTSVKEKDILSVKSGMAAEVLPTASKELKQMGTLEIDLLPGKGGVFGAEVKIDKPNRVLRPGMTCKVAAILGEARDVVVVPASAVKDSDGKKVVIAAKSEDGPFTERAVVTGLSDGKKIAILEGLSAGEFVRP